ncbi:MAG: bifunctional sulfate adenylyltransferase/adenylylsulfate kinase [SAR324 cluster bacterium]
MPGLDLSADGRRTDRAASGIPQADGLPPPHGGALTHLLVASDEANRLRDRSRDWPSIDLTPRQICDLELLLNGGFSPLTGFLGRKDHESVVSSLRLAGGVLWPMPITLTVPKPVAERLETGTPVGLRDPDGTLLAVLDVQDLWQTDWRREAREVFGTLDASHPGVRSLQAAAGEIAVGGPLRGVALPRHYDFNALRHAPADLRAVFRRDGWTRVVAFQTRNPMHRAHKELTERAAREAGARLLLHPVVGLTQPGDMDRVTRVRCYQALAGEYPAGQMKLSLLNLAMRMGGPREALWHAIVGKNHGCGYFIVGRDHAGPGKDSRGHPFYEPYAAQDLLRQFEKEAGVTMVPFRELVFVPSRGRYFPSNEIPQGAQSLTLSGTELRRRLGNGEEIPEWFTYPSVAAELRRAYPPKAQQGFTLFFTGLSGAGKSTIANILLAKLTELGSRTVSLLDGDQVRKTLSAGLGFSKADRDANILRIGLVAAEITKHRGIAICAQIAPYADARQQVRGWVSKLGGFIEIHVATPLEVCEQRDRKGLYAKARAGQIEHFTGLDDPYEAPTNPELRFATVGQDPEANAEEVLAYLRREGYLA